MMPHRMRAGVVLVTLLAQASFHGAAGRTLSVRTATGWREWWRASEAPAQSAANADLAGAVEWRPVSDGIERGVVEVSAQGEGSRTRIVVVRIDPRRHLIRLQPGLSSDFSAPAWTVDEAAPEALVALNAGQFTGIVPWGWTVIDGEEIRRPGTGPLSMAVTADNAGQVSFVPPDSIESVRRKGGIRTALQSYPTLLEGQAQVPLQLTEAGMGVQVDHRDARLALGQLADGRLLVALTRFDGLGDVAASVPFGLTLEEMAAIMRGLGCSRAVALDGGISSQLMVREPNGDSHFWRAWRKVPLGLIVEARAVERP